jgi:hypothetical protein
MGRRFESDARLQFSEVKARFSRVGLLPEWTDQREMTLLPHLATTYLGLLRNHAMKATGLVLGLAAVVFQIATLPAEPSLKDLSPDKCATYRLRPGDVVSVIVFQEEKLGLDNVTINPGGGLTVRAIPNEVHIAGLSIAEAQMLISKEYVERGIVANPQVTVRLEAPAGVLRRSSQQPNRLADPTSPNGK